MADAGTVARTPGTGARGRTAARRTVPGTAGGAAAAGARRPGRSG
ncbi:hypothetical protein ACFPN0_08870 [Kitasatospora cinereorecta]